MKISFKDTFWLICCSILGIGFLAIPFVIKSGGIWTILAIVLVNVLANYTGQILIKCHYDEIADATTGKMTQIRTRESYSEVGRAIWPNYGRQIVLFCQVLELLFTATFCPIIALSILPVYIPQSELSTALSPVFIGFLLYPCVFLRQVYQISKFGSITVISSMAVTVFIFVYCLTTISSWRLTEMQVFFPEEFLKSIGVFVTGSACHMYLPFIESKMKNPERFGAVMNYGFTLMTLLKIVIGVVGYLTFGQATLGVITLNLPTGVLSIVGNAVVLLLAISCYTLPMFSVFQILEMDSPLFKQFHGLEEPEKTSNNFVESLIRLGARSTMVLITLFVALAVPHFALFASFIGFFTASLLSNIFPCLFYVILKYETLNKKQIAFNAILIMLHMCVMAIGLYVSFIDIVTAFRRDMGISN